MYIYNSTYIYIYIEVPFYSFINLCLFINFLLCFLDISLTIFFQSRGSEATEREVFNWGSGYTMLIPQYPMLPWITLEFSGRIPSVPETQNRNYALLCHAISLSKLFGKFLASLFNSFDVFDYRDPNFEPRILLAVKICSSWVKYKMKFPRFSRKLKNEQKESLRNKKKSINKSMQNGKKTP